MSERQRANHRHSDAVGERQRANHRHSGAGSGSRPDDEDAATVIAILTALAASSAPDDPQPAARSVWADPAHRLGQRPGADGWWASGLPR